MKRLLAYLFIVLGLGLTYNVNAHAFGKGVKVSVDPRSLGTQMDDSVMQKNLATRLALINKDYLSSVRTKVSNGRIFLKGKVENPEEKLQITKLAWEITGVRSIKNDIKIKDQFKQSAKDLLITSQLRTALIFNNNIKASNYQIDTYKKKIYVYGIALTSEEKDLVISEAKEILNVIDVIASILLIEDLKVPKNIEIAKAEPSQTQKVAKGNVLCFVDWPSNIDYPEYSISGNVFIQKLKYDDGSNCNMKIFKSKNKKLYNRVASSAREVWIGTEAIKVDDTKLVLRYIHYKTLNKIYDEQNLSLAKIYPKKKSYLSSKYVSESIYCVDKSYSSIEKIRNQANINPSKFKKNIADRYFRILPSFKKETTCEKLTYGNGKVNASQKEYEDLFVEYKTNRKLLLNGDEPLKIAKVEPSQTQKVAKSETYCLRKDYGHVLVIGRYSKCSDQKALFNGIVQKIYPYEIDYRTFFNIRKLSFKDKDKKESKIIAKSFLQAYLASKKPSQTQKVAEIKDSSINTHEGIICVVRGNVIKKSGLLIDGGYASLNIFKNENKSCKNINNSENISYKEYLKVLKNPYLFLSQYGDLQNQIENKICIDDKALDINNSNKNCLSNETQLLVTGGSKNIIFLDTVKKRLAVKPKKKVKVAKVESKQEEFKPKKTNQDNEAPVIEIAEAITVDSQAYTLKGKVKDKSQIYLTINGRQVDVKKGKFELDRFSIDPDVAEELKIVAIDQWNNKSEKIVKVTIDLQSADIVKVYEELKPNNVKVKTDNNKIAIIIGIEKYENLTNLDAKYANRDAQAFRTYATRALGIKPSNIKMLIDDKATRSQALKAFKLWLPKIAGKGGKDIHIFFAGHGLASDNGEDLYILPQDGESSLLEDTAISRVELISLINKVNPKSVTMFFDTCYSGQTRDERMLVAGLRPIRIVADEQETPDNFTIFTASNYDQTSGSIEEAEHGMFSYYLMKGLEGNADNNKDKKITNGELIAYLKDNVSQEAFTQNRQQDPMLAGDPDKVLLRY